MELRPEEITKIIRSQIKNYEAKLEVSETGIVILVGDGIAKASGLEKCMAGELVEFPNGAYGMAQNLEEETVSIVILGSDNGIKEGDYSWEILFADGTFQFAGVDADTVILACNAGTNGGNKFRGYKTTTLTGQYADEYFSYFTLYKLN